MAGHTEEITALTKHYDYNGNLALGSRDSSVKVWDRVMGKLLFILKGYKRLVETLAELPNGYLASIGGGDVLIRNPNTGVLIYTL